MNFSPTNTQTKEAAADSIVENLVSIVPVLHRKILRMDLGGVTGNLTRLHLGIMARLREGSMTASELARVSIVPKPQMTHLIDQLVDSGIVARNPDSSDRRVINIALTERGVVLLEELKLKVQQNVRKELEALSPNELNEMSKALEILKRIASKL
jgi:DNA-binding MarR family transcriptional regulator